MKSPVSDYCERTTLKVALKKTVWLDTSLKRFVLIGNSSLAFRVSPAHTNTIYLLIDYV